MRLTLESPLVALLPRRETAFEEKERLQVQVLLPDFEESRQSHLQSLPVTLELPSALLEKPALLRQFQLVLQLDVDQEQRASHAIPLINCIPWMKDTQLQWICKLSPDREVLVTIPVFTDRVPRQFCQKLLQYKEHAQQLVTKMSSHPNMIAALLTPFLLMAVASATLAAPIWIPIAGVITILGFPLWVVVGAAIVVTALVASVSMASILFVLQSQKFQKRLRDWSLSPNAQYLLFQGAAENRDGSAPTISFAKLNESVVEQVQSYINDTPSRKLLASLLIDALGNMSFALPGIGEAGDVVWAPISAWLLSQMYDSSVPSAKYVGLVEELLPFTDLLPTATLAWMKEQEVWKRFFKPQGDKA